MTIGAWEVSVERCEDAELVNLRGAVDASNINQVKDRLETLCTRNKPRVLIDCSMVNYLNSTAFGLLYHCHQLCVSNHGRLVLFGVPQKIADIMKILGLDSILTICRGKADALKKVHAADDV